MFDPVDPRQSFPDLEQGILSYWKDEDIFKRSIKNREGAENFSFYDGPPFATGLPHYGHLLAGTIKDVIPRYQTMKGKRVERRFGWDCHGLPVEYEIEKEHNIKGKKDIEEMGVKTFNDLCRGIVQRYTKEWRTTVERTGRFVDMDHDYKTMDPSFMESIWWVFQSLFEKGLIYEGHKPMHVCPRCGTPISNFEVTQGYKDIQDYSLYVKLELTDEPGTYLIVWTTTGWTLPGNVLAAVNPAFTYAKVKSDGGFYIVAKDLVASVFKNIDHEIVEEISAEKLIGKTYKPLFLYYVEQLKERGFRVVASDLVTADAGSGIVHEAPAFGEDDFYLGQREKMPLIQHVGLDGIFKKEVTDFAGQAAKPKEDHQSGDKLVAAWLKEHGKLFRTESFMHSYPHCWRCDSPLLNYATSSWFVSVEQVKKDMLLANAETEWVPAHLRDGRFGKWLENARDWAISRNRYWGTPLPIWRTDDKRDVDVIMGRDDLMAHKLIRFTKVTVLRHGQSEGNLVPMYQSTVPGSSLTEKGKEQAKKAGEFINQSQHVPTVIYCSPMGRTMQTAQAVADATGARIVVDDRLREIDVGEHEGKTIPVDDLAISRELRREKESMKMPQSTYHLPGMEPWDSVQKRITSFFEEVLPKHRSEHIVVVTHGDPMYVVQEFFTKEDPFKIVRQSLPTFATPVTYFWDHAIQAQMDLHKDVMDDVVWSGSATEESVHLTLVRHGQTDLNKNAVVQGSEIDTPLNEEGHKQAEALAKTLSKGQFDVILSSHLTRAVETADYLAKALGIPHEEKLDLLRERDLGAWTNQKIEQVTSANRPAWDGVNPAMNHHTPENGESLQQFFDRAEEAAAMLRKKYAGKRVLLVAHGGFIQAMRLVIENRPYADCTTLLPQNTETVELPLNPTLKRIPDVLDCWFESGSMPYAQAHYPFEQSSSDLPPGFPADFIAEGIDQTRGWFYTLTVLSASLFKKPAFKHCIVNGTVLAEDGRKMSKRLKNYPDPVEVIDQHGADALRFALMSSPAVRAEDLRFSAKVVEETVRNVLLPLWNSYSFFVTYANAANFEPATKPTPSNHPLDKWIKAEVQDLVNRMTEQLEQYDLSATCAELGSTIDALTNWYIRLSRRRFAGKNSGDCTESYTEGNELERQQALATLHEVLLTICQVLAPFCPFITDSIYLNLSPVKHGSIHLTNWPDSKKLSKEDDALIRKNRVLRLVVRLGNKIRSEKKIKVRQPLLSATIALPVSVIKADELASEDLQLLRQELNVKDIKLTEDAGSLGQSIAMVDARKAGPRFGKRVQELIVAGKAGEFTIEENGEIRILDELLSPEEVKIIYNGREGADIAAEGGVVVSMETALTDELIAEGYARDIIRSVQKLRKEAGLAHTDTIVLTVSGMDDVMATHSAFIAEETKSSIGISTENSTTVDIEDKAVTISFHKV